MTTVTFKAVVTPSTVVDLWTLSWIFLLQSAEKFSWAFTITNFRVRTSMYVTLVTTKVIPQLNPFWYINWSVPGYFWQEDQWLVTSLKTPNCLGLSLSQWLNLNLADCSILDGLRNGIKLVGKIVHGFVEGIQFCVGPLTTSARRSLIFWALKRM